MSDLTVLLPDGLETYKRTSSFNEETVPRALRQDHSTKAGTWGLIQVESGSLLYRVTDPRRAPSERVLTPDEPPGVVEPTILHNVTPIGRVCFHVAFLRDPSMAEEQKI